VGNVNDGRRPGGIEPEWVCKMAVPGYQYCPLCDGGIKDLFIDKTAVLSIGDGSDVETKRT